MGTVADTNVNAWGGKEFGRTMASRNAHFAVAKNGSR